LDAVDVNGGESTGNNEDNPHAVIGIAEILAPLKRRQITETVQALVNPLQAFPRQQDVHIFREAAVAVEEHGHATDESVGGAEIVQAFGDPLQGIVNGAGLFEVHTPFLERPTAIPVQALFVRDHGRHRFISPLAPSYANRSRRCDEGRLTALNCACGSSRPCPASPRSRRWAWRRGPRQCGVGPRPRSPPFPCCRSPARTAPSAAAPRGSWRSSAYRSGRSRRGNPSREAVPPPASRTRSGGRQSGRSPPAPGPATAGTPRHKAQSGTTASAPSC